MRLTTLTASLGLLLTTASALKKPLDIEIIGSIDCPEDERTKVGTSTSLPLSHPLLPANDTPLGDHIDMHYTGTLEDGTEFDSSHNRNQPLSFHLGKGMVIKGWDEGLQDMCVGDKRKLTIQPEYGYGDRGVGPIPGGAVLIFETELVEIKGNVHEEL
ncbi:hypothetical protein BT93_L0757 [Corymbia citriodora subsp. variegata]|uniref:peptidylprolyl isomerase n=1 Tax=Corymbia citriodora subsp. variegata TaxID=360336 RepID=A0A8T0CEF5_CORYI|nr:hypothetical protein BT93_L0757 [Corymbia citriodora subsp. variegata]